MKLIKIVVWATPGYYTFLRRHYTNPNIEHIVVLNPDKVSTFLRKDDIAQPFEPGIQHLIRPL